MAAQATPAHPAAMQMQLETSTAPDTPTCPTPILKTKRLIIRPMYLEDAQSAALHANDPLISRYMSLTFPNPYTLDRAKEWINMNLALAYQEAFVLCEHASPEIVIGGIGLKPGRDVSAHTAEVGFWIGQPYWGKGFMTEALEGFTKWAFENWDKDGQRLRRLWGNAFAPNVGSMRCFEKCGYAKEGVMKGHCEKNGEVMDMHVFGLTKADWEKKMSEVSST